jgi:penicillin-binding protein 1C
MRGNSKGQRPGRRAWLLRAVAGAGAGLHLLLFALAGLALWRARLEAPPPTRLLLDRDGRFLAEIGEIGEIGEAADPGLGYWPIGRLPPRVVAATLALEDHRFAFHPGIDPLAAGRAVLQNVRSRGRVSGASTLAMQVARLQHPGARGYPRKIVEAATAVLLTALHGREEILRHYLRIVPYGNRIHGIAYAARGYFDKPVADLSWAEIAFLAALPQAPARMNPFLPEGRLRAVHRGERVLDWLAARGVLDAAEHDLARRQLAALRIPLRRHRPPEAMHFILHLKNLLPAGDGQAESSLRCCSSGLLKASIGSPPATPRSPSLPSGGEGDAPTLSGWESRDGPGAPLIVRTSLDLELQRQVTAMTWRAVREWAGQGAGNASLLVVELRRSEVLAWVGSTDYFADDDKGAIDYARVRRSAGSTLKPFLYALALERGQLSPATILDDVERGPGGIANADDRFLGPLLPRVALANSRNVPAARLLAAVGLDQGFGLFRELGLTDGALPARHYGLGLAIGGLPVTLEELARAYLALAGDGRLAELRWLRRQSPPPLSPPPRRIFSEETARLVTLFLSDPMARLPSFPRMGPSEYRFPVAVKTGTSTNYHDAWAVAYSTRYLVACWVGHPGFRAMDRLSGYHSAAFLVQRVLELLHREQNDGLEDLSFPPPRGFRPVRVCALTGRLATAACDRVLLEWFRPGEEPADRCAAHQQRAVDRRDGLLATAATPRQAVEIRTFVDLPPRYAAWQAGAGLPRPPEQASPLTVPEGPEGAAGAEGGWAGGTRAGRAARQAAPEPASDWKRSSAAGPRRGPAGSGGEPRSETGVGASGFPRLAGSPVRLRITSPENGARLLRDPETPQDMATLALGAVVDPPADEVVWYVDGRPLVTARYPYTARWRLAAGEHVFRLRLPFTDTTSRPVSITVQ